MCSLNKLVTVNVVIFTGGKFHDCVTGINVLRVVAIFDIQTNYAFHTCVKV